MPPCADARPASGSPGFSSLGVMPPTPNRRRVRPESLLTSEPVVRRPAAPRRAGGNSERGQRHDQCSGQGAGEESAAAGSGWPGRGRGGNGLGAVAGAGEPCRPGGPSPDAHRGGTAPRDLPSLVGGGRPRSVRARRQGPPKDHPDRRRAGQGLDVHRRRPPARHRHHRRAGQPAAGGHRELRGRDARLQARWPGRPGRLLRQGLRGGAGGPAEDGRLHRDGQADVVIRRRPR
jgi:hypothetical protein